MLYGRGGGTMGPFSIFCEMSLLDIKKYFCEKTHLKFCFCLYLNTMNKENTFLSLKNIRKSRNIDFCKVLCTQNLS